MRLLKVDTLQEARQKLLAAAITKAPKTEKIHFTETEGRILAENLYAAIDIPHFRRSSVDGYAVKASDTQGVTDSVPVFLDVIETVDMGQQPSKAIKSGQATYVPTGGMVPEGADAIVMIEYCESFDESSIAVYEPVSPGRNIIAEGEDVKSGNALLPKGKLIRPQEIGVMAASGIWEAEVFKPWKITIISTGDELISGKLYNNDSHGTSEAGNTDVYTTTESISKDPIPKESMPKGRILDINTYSISAAARRMGLDTIGTSVVKDDEQILMKVVGEAMKSSDIVVVSGGSSQGEKDHTAHVMDKLATPGVFTHGIALKPGKPTILGYDKGSETILIGLPGHPAAALMVFELMIGWLHRKLTEQKEPLRVTAEISENVAAAGGKTTCVLVELDSGENLQGHIYRATPIFGKSGLMTTLTRADGYVMIDTDTEGLREGQQISVILF